MQNGVRGRFRREQRPCLDLCDAVHYFNQGKALGFGLFLLSRVQSRIPSVTQGNQASFFRFDQSNEAFFFADNRLPENCVASSRRLRRLFNSNTRRLCCHCGSVAFCAAIGACDGYDGL